MNQDEFNKMIKEYIEENITIESKLCGGDYGSCKYIKISIVLEGKEIDCCYIDI